MSLDDHKKNIVILLEEKSNLLQALSCLEKQIDLVIIKDLEKYSSQLEPNAEDKDYFCYLTDRLTGILDELSIVNNKIAATRSIFYRLLRLSTVARKLSL